MHIGGRTLKMVIRPIIGKILAPYLGDASVPMVQSHDLSPSPIDSSWIISGEPAFRSTVFHRSFGTSSGVWECEGPGQFFWKYDVDETIFVMRGFAEIEYLGKEFTVRPGDSVHFVPGTKAVWSVPVSIGKTFRIQSPGLLTQMATKVLRMI
jgi:uncharacterized protein